ncbi:streptophobe family protein [Streptomyces sp. 147326]|uniref:streptophobe family protein n=1 Tax=Streptomyces sp. 147326 TaxID=3074379 RepID=UPI0038579A37
MRRIRWGDVLVSAVAAVGWSLIVMAGVAGLGLHLLGADAAGGSLGAMTAAVVVLAVGGTVTPSGDVSAFGVVGAGAETSLDVMPLGVALAGALVLGCVFVRSLRAGAGPGETAARVLVLTALFVATAGGLAWAGHDVVTLDGTVLPKTPAKVEIPGIGDIGELLPDRIGDLIETRTRIGFSVETGPTLLGAGLWALAVLAVALLVSRRGPAAFARIRPAASAVVAMLLVAVAAGLAAAVWAALGDAHPRRVIGAALLGAPNGSWLGVLLGLFVPVRGRAEGEPARLLPSPLDDLLAVSAREPVTVTRLAEYDGRVWLLVAGVSLLLLYAGVLAAVRTPVGTPAGTVVRTPVRAPGRGVLGCAARLSAVMAVALAGLVWLTGLSADASLAVLGVDAVDAGVELRGSLPLALLLGAVWGAVAGAAGAVLAPRRRAAFPGPVQGWPDPQAPTAAYPGGVYGPRGPQPGPGGEADGSWDVTVTGIPPWSPRSPRPPKPPRREPFTPPPPPGAPPPRPKPPR